MGGVEKRPCKSRNHCRCQREVGRNWEDKKILIVLSIMNQLESSFLLECASRFSNRSTWSVNKPI